MATRYLTALDFSDWNTQNVLRKHAKNRPLGQLEWRYRYTQEQPLLSCRTVGLDAAGGGAGCGDGGGGGSLRTTSRSPGVKSAGVRRSASPSSSDVWQEQQKVLRHLLQNGRRSATSAPSGRSEDSKGAEQTRTSSARRGRPSTSLSTSSNTSRPKSTASSNRFKSAGRPKSSSSSKSGTSESFMVVTVDKDMLRTRRTYHDLTNRIHAHWRPGSSDLNQGHFRRGQKRPDNVPTASDAWLTFGGATEEGSEGVIDAFANFQSPELYYNIVGSVGSRVAQQLRKGDKIRIGINGEVVSHDLRVKRWVKDKQDPDEEVEEEEEEEAPTVEGEKKEERVEMEVGEEKKEEGEEEEDNLDGEPGSEQENPPSPASYTEQEVEFGELVVDSFDILTETPTEEDEEEEEKEKEVEELEKKEKDLPAVLPAKVRDSRASPERGSSSSRSRPASSKKIPVVDFPLNWDDQVNRPEVKVISARRGARDNSRENLCETHPVVYHTLIRRPHTTSRPRMSSSSSTSSSKGYRIKQRPLSSSSSSRGSSIALTSSAAVRNRLDSASGKKVRAITIDQNSEEQERRLNDMSIEDVIQTRLEVAAASAASSPVPGAMRGHLRSPYRSSSSSLSPRSQIGREERGGGGEFRKCSSMGTLYGRQRNSARGEGGSSARSPRAKGSSSAGPRSPSSRSPLPHNRSPTPTSPSPYSAYERRTLGVPRPSSSSVPYYYDQQRGGARSARDVRDLGTVSMRPLVLSSGRGGTNGSGAGSRTERQSSSGKGPRPMTGQPQYRGPGNYNGSPVMGSSSIKAGAMPGDPHFIQISQPIRNPNSSRVPLVSGLRSSFFYSPFPVNSMAASPVPPHVGGSPQRSNTPESMLQEGMDMMTSSSDVFAALSRPLTPSVQGDPTQEESPSSLQGGATTSSTTTLNAGNGNKDSSREATAVAPVPGAALSASSSGPPVHVMQAINIPTGNDEEEDDEEETTEVQKGARKVVGERQIDQVTHLLGGATLGEERN